MPFIVGLLPLFAEAGGGAAAPPANGGGAGGMLSLLTLWLPLLVLAFFLFIRPQQKEKAQRQAMLAGLKKNDKVVTVGGLYGVVTNVQMDADEITLRVDESSNTKIRVTLGSIARVISEDAPAGDTPSK